MENSAQGTLHTTPSVIYICIFTPTSM